MTNCSHILRQMCEFYTRLSRSSSKENANKKSYLNEKQKMELDEFPSLKECDEAKTKLKPNKSPGFDGLRGEYFQPFGMNLNHISIIV